MEAFKAGELDALVSTTVIEVGWTPNAAVMVIETPSGNGLSALHQLRGRVGRGAQESWCFLVSDHGGESVQERLQFLCHTQDGFEIAKYDLEHRALATFSATGSSACPPCSWRTSFVRHPRLEAAQKAPGIARADPKLAAPGHQALAAQVERLFRRTTFN